MAFTDPLLDATRVENVLFVANERSYHFAPSEVAPADGALLPEFVPRCLTMFLLFAREGGLIQGAQDLWHWQGHRQDGSEYALYEALIVAACVFAPILVPAPHHVDSALDHGPNQTNSLHQHARSHYIVEDWYVGQCRYDLESNKHRIAKSISSLTNIGVATSPDLCVLRVRNLEHPNVESKEDQSQNWHHYKIAADVQHDALLVIPPVADESGALNRKLRQNE